MNLLPLYNNRIASVLSFLAGLLSVSTAARGQSCKDTDYEGTIFFQGEALPIELSGFFPYILDNTTSLPLQKYKSEKWNGLENIIVPACSNYAAYDNIVLSGTWTFSAEDFSDTSTKTSTYNGTTTSNIKDGLYRPTHTEATKREMIYGEPILSSCGSYVVFHHTNCTEELSGEFTLADAQTRAEKFKTVGGSSDGVQYWNNSSPATVAEALQAERTDPIKCHATRMSFKVQFPEIGSCGGNKISLSFYYKKWSLSQPEPAQYTDVKTEEVEFKSPPYIFPISGDYQKYPYELKQGEQCKLVKVVARKSCDQHSPGDSSNKNGSVDAIFSLGKRTNGQSVGTLELRASVVDPSLYTPAALLLAAPDSPDVTALRQGNSLRQVLTPQSLVDVVTLTESAYELRYYTLAQVGALNTATGLYSVSGTPFVSHLIENPDSTASGTASRLRITESKSGIQKVTIYSFDSDANIMTMTSGGGARVEQLETVTAEPYVTTTRTIKDATGKVSSVVREVKSRFPFGLQLVKRVIDPAGLALTTNYGYYEDPGSVGAYGLPRYIGEPSGRWERYTYDTSGRLVGTVSQYLDNAWETPDAQNRQVLVNYGSIADLDGDGLPEALVTTVTSIAGNETRRSHHITYSKIQSYGSESTQLEKFIDSIVPGAAWDAASNLVTTSTTIVGGRFDGKPATERRPDGTLTLYQYSENATSRTTTVAQGAPNLANTAVVAGTSTTTVTDLFGNLQATTVKDIASGLELSAQTVTDQDLFGRPTRIEDNNGAIETRSYACCGLENQTGKDGILTHYEYDALGHVTSTARAGISIISSFDPEGRLLTLTRQGFDGSSIVQQTNVYNLAGQLISMRDAVGRLTLFAESTNDPKHKIKNVTYADSGTRNEEYYQDGTLGWVTGTAITTPARYLTGFDSEGQYIQEIRSGSGGEQTEWQKTYSDLLGRTTKTVYADGAFSASFYNDAGQLSKTVDPDGVTTLFAYNALGEQETVAVDLNRNGAIDLTGTDRITKTTSGIASANGTTVRRTTTAVWTADGAASTQDVSIAETSVDGMRSWTTVHGLTTQSTLAYPAAGLRTETTVAADGTQAVRQYNNDRLVSQTILHPSIGTLSSISYGYDAQGRVQSTTDARSGTTAYTYFDDDQTKSVTTPDPDLSRTGAGYDAQTTSYLYDVVGRLYQTSLPDTTTVTQEYYLTGQLKKTYGSRTYPQAYAYDGQGRLKTLTTWQDYVGDTGKAVTTWNYDSARGWLISKKYTDGAGPSYSYYASGRLNTRTWVRGVTTTYGYNSAGDLSNITYSDATPNVSLNYDRIGRLSVTRDAAGTLTRTYHSSGQLQDESYDSTGLLANCAVHRGFDAFDRLNALTPRHNAADLPGATYDYDAASRLQAVAQGAAAVAYSYLPNSTLVGSLTFSNNGTSRLTTTKTYDRMNRLTSIVNTPSASSASSSAYTYNAANQRTKLVREDNAYWDFGYDAMGQLTQGGKKLSSGDPMLGLDYTYTYDDIGNRKNSTTNGNTSAYTSNLLNQYLQATVPGVIDVLGTARSDATVKVNGTSAQRQTGSFYAKVPVDNTALPSWAKIAIDASSGADTTSQTRHAWVPKSPEVYRYDADGNLMEDGRWIYTWDAENRLISMETRSILVPPTGSFPFSERRRLDFTYDAQGRRIEKKVFGWSPQGWNSLSDQRFLYDGWNLAADFTALGTSNLSLQCSYVWGLDLSGSLQGAGGVGGLLFTTKAGSTYATGYDGNGNVQTLINLADGSTSADFEYDPFGNTIKATGAAANVCPFGFSTKYTDSETNLLYYGFRYYNPSTGQWVSRDPVEENGGANLYCFVENNVFNAIDILGLSPVEKSCRELSFKIKMGVESAPKIDLGIWHIRESFSVDYTVKLKICDECCGGKNLHDTYWKAEVSGYFNDTFSVTAGLDIERRGLGLDLRVWAGARAELAGGAQASGTFEKSCGVKRGSLGVSLKGSGTLKGGGMAKAKIGIWQFGDTGVEIGGVADFSLNMVRFDYDPASGLHLIQAGKLEIKPYAYYKACFEGACYTGKF